MGRFRLIYLCVVCIALVLCGCTVNLSPSSSIAPTVPVADSTSVGGSVSSVSTVPVTWTNLGLKGRLVYIYGFSNNDEFKLQVRVLNLVTGEVTTIFDAPKYSWLYYVTVSPDNKQVIMSYSPPPSDNNTPPDQNLYTLPIDGSQPPQLLFMPPTVEDEYVEVDMSPDGRYMYFTHVNYQLTPQPGQLYPLYEIYRMPYPNGQLEKVASKSYWPRISPDSTRIAYISVDLFEQGNKLFVGDADGKNAHEVKMTGDWVPDIKDAPLFSSDGQSILFSGDVPPQSYQLNWFDKVMGVQVAEAHSNVLSDWWSVPVNGGNVTRLTSIGALNLFGSRSPDNQYIVSYSANSIFVMKPDGSEVTTVIPNPQGVPGTVSWIP